MSTGSGADSVTTQSFAIAGWVPAPLSNVHADHWRKREKKLKAAHLMVWAAAKQAAIKPIAGRARVTVTLTFAVHRRRDADNLYSRCKGIFDGLVKGGWLVDDSTDWLDPVVKAEVCRGSLSTLVELEALG